MITKEQAAEIVLREINKPPLEGGERAITETIEKPYGWMFFYQTKRSIETGNRIYALIGNGPIVVDRDGTIHHLGMAPLTSEDPWNDFIAAYDRKRASGL